MEDNKLFTEFPPISTEKWEEVITKDLKGADYDKKLLWKTIEGFNVKPYYRAEDLQNLEYMESNPGQFPFTRGQHPDNNIWDIRQDILLDNPAQANQLALDMLNRGVNSLGLCASNVHTIHDMETLLHDINPEAAKINFLCSHDYKLTLQLFLQFLQDHHYDPTKVQGSCGFDMFRHAMTFGTFHRTEEGDLNAAAQLVTFSKANLPLFRPLTIHGSLFHNAGSNIVQELAFSLSAANELMARLSDLGCQPQDVASSILFEYAIGSTYFMEIAKFRASRLLWSKIVEQYHPSSTSATKSFIHAVTSTWNKSIFDPYVNMLRTTTETMSAAIAGADSICTQPFDIAYKTSDDFGYRIARNQQILLKEESYMDKIVDPAAGSYYIENLTDSIAQHAWQLFLTIEDKGGFCQAIRQGFVQEQITLTAQQRDMDIATRRTTVLGTNQYPNLAETMGNKIQPQPTCTKHLTPGTDLPILHTYRGAEAFEQLRLATEQASRRPKVFLLTYGNLAMRKARAGFASNFFGVAGYHIIDNPGFTTAAEGIAAALQSQADVVVLCSSDEEYNDIAQEVCLQLKGKVRSIVLAGHPKDMIDTYKSYGIDQFIHIKTNALQCLTDFNNLLLNK